MLREYFAEMVSRYQGRPATPSEVDEVLAAEPSDALAPPSGAFLVARAGDAVLGCAGLLLMGEGVGEVKRVFVTPAARRTGLGTRLMLELEAVARRLDVRTLRLDTRRDLVEARSLYVALGYQEVPAFNAGPYAEHWFAKPLT